MMSFEITLIPYNIRDGYIQIPAEKMDDFPNTTTYVELLVGNQIYKVKFYVRESHHGFSRLTQLLKEHELKAGDNVRIIETKHKCVYRLEIVK